MINYVDLISLRARMVCSNVSMNQKKHIRSCSDTDPGQRLSKQITRREAINLNRIDLIHRNIWPLWARHRNEVAITTGTWIMDEPLNEHSTQYISNAKPILLLTIYRLWRMESWRRCATQRMHTIRCLGEITGVHETTIKCSQGDSKSTLRDKKTTLNGDDVSKQINLNMKNAENLNWECWLLLGVNQSGVNRMHLVRSIDQKNV